MRASPSPITTKPPTRLRASARHHRPWLWAAAVSLLAWVPVGLASSEACERATIEDRGAGSCSVSGMVDGLDTSRLVWMQRGQPGYVVPPADSEAWYARHTDWRAGPFPGEGHLRFSGLIQAGGAACSHHVQALDAAEAGGGPAADINLERLPEAMREKVRKARKRAEQARESARGQRARLASAGDGVVLSLFSPQLGLFELGVEPLGISGSAKASHPSIAGWPANSTGKVTIVLPGTEHTELRAGETYEAVVRGKDQTLYSDARGRSRDFPRDGGTQTKRLCRQGKQSVAAKWQNFPAVVSQAQSQPCDRKAYFEGTTRRVSATQLTGEVSITAITDERVTGRFRLEGQARLEASDYRFIRGNAPDADQIYYPKPDTRQVKQIRVDDNRRGSLTVSGSFAAPNTISGLSLNPNYRDGSRQAKALRAQTVIVPNAGADESAADERAPFRVASHQPRANKRNVDGTDPQITLSFNHRIEPNSLSPQTLTLAYRDAQGSLQEVPLRINRTGQRRVQISPKRGLKDGVRYRVTAKGGNQGLQSRAGESLASDYRWAFYTLVNLDRKETVPAVKAHLQGTSGVEPHVFQTARDAPLVPGKNTLTRVYAKWRADQTVAEGWQVKRFLADVRVKGDQPLYPAKERVMLTRPDQWTAAYRQRAANSVNFYGWRPRSGDGSAMTAEIEPADQCRDEPRIFESESRDLSYTTLTKDLDIDYYIVRAGNWSGDALTSGKAQWALPAAQRIAAEGASYTTQNFPVWRTNTRYHGTLTAETGGLFTNQWPVSWSTDRWLVHQIKQKLKRFNPDADAVMLFFAGDISATGGKSYRERALVRDWLSKSPQPQLQTGLFGLFLDRNRANMISKATVDVAHELGHILLDDERHLSRGDWLGDYANTAGQRIEGFRLSQWGQGGTNKSTTEGNGHPKGTKVYPLMVAGQTPAAATFITNDNYERLIETIAEPPSRLTRRNARIRLASADDTVPEQRRPVWLVGGLVEPDGNRARIDAVSPGRGSVTRPDNAASDARVQLRDDAGDVIAAAPVAIPRCGRTGEAQACPFTVRLPRQDGVAAATLSRNGEVVAHHERTGSAPRLTVAEPSTADGTVELAWDARDPDSDRLSFDVSYSRDGSNYRPLALGLTAQQITIPAAELAPGSRPRLRLTASDGFNATQRTVGVGETAGLRVLATVPSEDGTLAPHSDVRIVLNAPLDPASVTAETIRLLGPDGERVPIEGRYKPSSQTIRIAPKEPLTTGRRYTGVVTDGVATANAVGLSQAHRWPFRVARARTDELGETWPFEESDATANQRNGQGSAKPAPRNPDNISLSLDGGDIAAMPFNKTKVRYWIKARIASNRLQDAMRANAGDYERVILAYFRKRKVLLEQAGWTVEDFEATAKRIRRADTGIDLAQQDDIYESDKEHIETTRPDWPAVRPYRDELEQLTNWVADNIDDPPQLD